LLCSLGNVTSASSQQQGKLFMNTHTHMHIKLIEGLTRLVGGRTLKNYRNVQAGQTSHILTYEKTYKHK